VRAQQRNFQDAGYNKLSGSINEKIDRRIYYILLKELKDI